MANKIALGKGLASLIKVDPTEILSREFGNQEQQPQRNEASTLMIPVEAIKKNSSQPRHVFREEELQELAQSIRENGIIQPLIVVKSEHGYELIAGERRLRAAKLAGLDRVPAVVKRVTEREKSLMAIIENVQRSDLNCIEEALAYFSLMDTYKLTQEEVATKVGKNRSSVANMLRLLKLPREVVQLLQENKLSLGHGKVLASIEDREHAIRLANLALTENLSVRELEKEAGKKIVLKEKSSAENFFEKKFDSFKDTLEKKTGYHFDILGKKNGSGEVKIKFNNEAEFNDVFEFLLKR